MTDGSFMDRDYTAVNSRTWDAWVDNGCEWCVPVTHEEYAEAKNGEWGVYLTPCRTVPRDWFPPLEGCRLLGLASGGGQQMPIFAALGARCTVLDNSERQLGAERTVAEREGYEIEIVRADMTKPLPFDDAAFDVVFHPVSNCYVEDVRFIWRECFRVLRPGGVLLAGMDNGINFLFEGDDPLRVVNRLPFNPLKMEYERYKEMADNLEAIQFSHTLEEQIGGQLEAGFILRALYEDRDRPGGAAIGEYAPQYIATLAIKPDVK